MKLVTLFSQRRMPIWKILRKCFVPLSDQPSPPLSTSLLFLTVRPLRRPLSPIGPLLMGHDTKTYGRYTLNLTQIFIHLVCSPALHHFSYEMELVWWTIIDGDGLQRTVSDSNGIKRIVNRPVGRYNTHRLKYYVLVAPSAPKYIPTLLALHLLQNLFFVLFTTAVHKKQFIEGLLVWDSSLLLAGSALMHSCS